MGESGPRWIPKGSGAEASPALGLEGGGAGAPGPKPEAAKCGK